MSMVDFERRSRPYLPEQQRAMAEILRTHAPIDEGRFRGDLGTFRIIDEWALRSGDTRTFPPKIAFSLKVLGKDPGKYYLDAGREIEMRKIGIRSRNFQLVSREGESTRLIQPGEIRLIDKIYSGFFRVGRDGWVIINIRNPQTGKPAMSDEAYEEMVVGAARGLDPRFYVDLPCVQVHPDYKGAVATVVLFDPLVDSLRQRLEVDGVVFSQEDGKLMPKRIIRLLSPEFWQPAP